MNILILFIIHLANILTGQDIYKTPHGKKYHLSSCRMVENVSQKLHGQADIDKYSLTPCKFCKPRLFSANTNNISINNKAVGESNTVQCKGRTKKGTRCLHMTSLANGYCFQHKK